MKQLKFGYPLIGAMAVVIGLTACADENPWGNTSKEKGKISISLTTNSGISTAKPIFRSGEETKATDPNNLNTYIKVPSPEDFSIKLEKSDGSYSKTWISLSAFKEEAAKSTFNTGSYTMTAFYGEKGKQDFDSPYFEASSSFAVLSDQTQEVSLQAELVNSMVKVNYTDAFKNYMKEYHTKIHTEGKTDDIIYRMDETKPAFLEPNNAALTVHFTTKDKDFTRDLYLGEFAPMAKTLHNLTLDITESQNGNRALIISFDETLEDEDISIDLTNELYTTPAPVITCVGFNNGETLDMLEGAQSSSDLKMNVMAEGFIESATLTVESSNYEPGWGKEIDLCKATDLQKQQIKTAGIEAFGFGIEAATDKSAFLTLTKFCKSLPKGVHKISLVVTDKNECVSEIACVILNSEEITILRVEEKPIEYGSGTVILTLDYNGQKPEDLVFRSNGQDLTVSSREDDTSTRAFETKRYIFTLTNVPGTTKSEVEISVSHKTKSPEMITIPVIVPEYQIREYDAFSKYAYLRVTAEDPTKLSTIIDHLAIKGNGNDLTIANRDASNGIITLTGLTPNTSYAVTSSITDDDWSSNGSLKTEEDSPINNGNFESKIVNYISFDNIQVGGKYKVSPVDYTLSSSIKRDTPIGWATINDLTAYDGSKNKNSWFIVPSTYVENGSAIIRSVGYNHDGTTPNTSGGAFNRTYYCENSPSDNQLERAAGELFLGSYTFNGSKTRDEGIGFSSRPSSISFDYKYTLDKGNHYDQGSAFIDLFDSEGNSLGNKEIIILDASTETKTITVDFNYGQFGKKAAMIKISFKSSNQQTPPIYIPSGSELNEGKTLGNHTLSANSYKAVAIGSELIIDNVVAHYGDAPGTTPAAAPKRKTTKRK